MSRQTIIDSGPRILEEERDIVVSSGRPLEATSLPGRQHPNRLRLLRERPVDQRVYTIDDHRKRAVGFKLSEGMEVPPELASRFKFARQKSKLAGTNSRFLLRRQDDYCPRHRALPRRDSAIPGREIPPREGHVRGEPLSNGPTLSRRDRTIERQ